MTSALPLRDVLLSIFFVALGMLFDPSVIVDEPATVIALVLVLVLGKTVIAALAAVFMRAPPRAAWLAGVGLAQFGEFGFILLTVAEAEALVTEHELRLVVSAGIVSMVVSRVAMGLAPRLRAGEVALQPLARLLQTRGSEEVAEDLPSLNDHVVVAGYGVAGRLVAHALTKAGIPVVALDVSAERVRDARDLGIPVYYGDVTSDEVLRHAAIDRARLLVLLINDRDALRRAIATARSHSPNVFIIARSKYVAEHDALIRLGASLVVYEEIEAGLEVATRVLTRFRGDASEVQSFVEGAIREIGHDHIHDDLETILSDAEEHDRADRAADTEDLASS